MNNKVKINIILYKIMNLKNLKKLLQNKKIQLKCSNSKFKIKIYREIKNSE